MSFGAKRCYGQDLDAATIEIREGARISDAPIELGDTARMRFLYADGTHHSSPNENSLVVRLDLGDTRVLLMGDAEAGGRHPPADPPAPGSIEGMLTDCCAAELRANILVAGHHGSMTSSRVRLLNAVGADTFVVSSGPTRYGSVTLPDQAVITELQSRGTVWRTDQDDAACAVEPNKIGSDSDGEAGGCHNIQIQVSDDGSVNGTYWMTAD